MSDAVYLIYVFSLSFSPSLSFLSSLGLYEAEEYAVEGKPTVLLLQTYDGFFYDFSDANVGCSTMLL